MTQNLISVRVWGDFACFTRPELKVERVSYSIMTPSAARGILEAIFWKPQIYYEIDSIKVIRKGKWTSIRRNEVKEKIPFNKAKSAGKGKGRLDSLIAGAGTDTNTQRNMLVLQGVEYVITAEVFLSELGKHSGQVLPKYKEEFARRAKAGKCFHRPALGLREFSAEFDWVEDPQEIAATETWNDDLGIMLYDVFAPNQRKTGFQFLSTDSVDTQPLFKKSKLNSERGRQVYDGTLAEPSATFFIASVKDSVLDCSPQRVEIIGGGAS